MNYRYILLALITVIVAGCSEEDTLSGNGMQEVRVAAGTGTNSRIVMNNQGNYTRSLWRSGDKISLFTATQSNLVYTTTLLQDSAYAEFTPAAEKLQYIEGNKVYATYPETTSVGNGIVVSIPSTNTLDYNNGSIRSFGYAVGNISEGSVDFTFRHISAFLCLTLTPEMLASATSNVVGSISVSTTSSVPLSVGKGDTFDFSTLTANTTSGSNTVEVTSINHTLTENWTVYIPVLPQPADATLTVTVAGNDGSTLYTLSKAAPATGFLAGNVYQLTLTGSGTTTTEEFGAVDLGLSVLWANFNLGATSPEDYGDYYAFGEIEPKTEYTFENWKSPSTLYLPAEKDAATQRLGEDWRMPTKAEVTELLTECTWELITIGEKYVYKVTGKTGNFIILPLTGSWDEIPEERFENYEARYRTSEAFLETGETVADPSTYVLELQKNFEDTEVDYASGWKGHPIRAVKGERKQEQVVDKLLLNMVESHDSNSKKYSFVYDSEGKIENIICNHSEGYGYSFQMSFVYSQNDSTIEVIYTTPGSSFPEDNFTFDITLNNDGYIKSAILQFSSENALWQYDYNNNGQLIKMNRSEGYEIWELKYDENNDAVNSYVFYEDASEGEEEVDTIIYSSLENKSNLAFHEILYGIDIDEMDDLSLIGLLGKPSKHLPVKRTNHYGTFVFEWEMDMDGYPTRLFVVEDGTDYSEYTFTWSDVSR